MARTTYYVKRASAILLFGVLAFAMIGAAFAIIPNDSSVAAASGIAPQNTNAGTTRAPKKHRTPKARGDKAQKGEAGGTDTNIKTPRAANNQGAAGSPAPAAKGGPKSRATACSFHVDNRTPYYIDIYTNGNYRGTVAPWDDLYGYVEYGAALYGRAEFEDGTFLYWRRSSASCPMTWILTP
jgi:hypothetical protein